MPRKPRVNPVANVGSFCLRRLPYPQARWKQAGVPEYAPNWIVVIRLPGKFRKTQSSAYEVCRDCKTLPPAVSPTKERAKCACQRPAREFGEALLRKEVVDWDEGRLQELRGDEGHKMSRNMPGGTAVAMKLAQINHSPKIKASTKAYYNQLGAALLKTWPEFHKMEVRKVTVEECEEWAGKVAAKYSATRYNNTIGLLQGAFELAIEKGVRRVNPAAKLDRVRPKAKDLGSLLPSRELFVKWVTAIRAVGAPLSPKCAEFVEFVAYSGVRKGETRFIELQHCDEERGVIRVVGDPVDRTKNSEVREVPMIPAMKDVLRRIRERRPDMTPTSKILQVFEAQGAMDAAGRKLRMARLTHHDLRHYFATMCIESKVDIPTVAKWLGHKDGGALLMRTYSHVRNAHSLAAAAQVVMAPVLPPSRAFTLWMLA